MRANVKPMNARRAPASALPCRVTVIIIFFNERQFLAEAVESVLGQTYPAWELLLIDDGSTDGSTELARRYARAHPETIRYLNHGGHVNRGMSASRNLGLAHARGEFVLYVDADDRIVPTTLEDQVTFLEAHPDVGTVYGPIQIWRSWSESRGAADADGITDLHLETDRVHDPVTVLTTFLLHEDAVPSGNMLRTDLARNVGGFEEEFTGLYEDQVFRVKLCRSAPAYVSSRIWYHYRKHPSSCCETMIAEGKMALARLRYLRWVKTFCQQHHESDRLVRRTINRALRPYRYPRLDRWQAWCGGLCHRWAWRLQNGGTDLVRSLLPYPIWCFLRDRVKAARGYRQESGWRARIVNLGTTTTVSDAPKTRRLLAQTQLRL